MSEKQVLAVVANREITQEDVNLLIRSLDPQRAMQFQSEEGQKRLLEELVNQELFYLDAVENNLEKDEHFQGELKKVQDNFLKQYAINELIRTAAIGEDETLNYYNENQDQFKTPPTTKASHILVETEEEAQEILEALKGDLSFEEAAEKHSKCPSNSRGGDLGYFPKGQMVPEFEEALINMEIGEISAPVKTQFGQHLIKLVDRKEEEAKSFDEVKNQLSQQLLAQKQQSLYSNKVQDLKGKYDVKINL
ncbi:MAG: peptidylprolyl isomerase [Clostridiaceae bacterium]|nr:peptidylprolyl isomerase [Clostridiaceae bacterium]